MPLPADVVRAGLRLTTCDEATATLRSYLPDGRCLGWYAPHLGRRMALDAELDMSPPAELARRFGARAFWERWTRAECEAKLTSTPIVVLLARGGMDTPTSRRLEFTTFRPTHLDPRLVVTIGIVRADAVTGHAEHPGGEPPS